jgi:hypothetical protein
MASIIKRQSRIVNAKAFLDRYDGVPTVTNNLYVALSGTTPWADETNPPIPSDTMLEETNFWSELIGMHKVSLSDVKIVIPRVDWVSGTQYFVYDQSLADPFTTKPNYILTSGFNVYVCEGVAVGGAGSTIEPSHTSTTAVLEADGYSWRYLYSVSAYDKLELLSTKWIPVSTALGYEDSRLVDARFVIIRAKILDTDLPTGVTYRKVGIISDPVLADNVTLASATNYVAADLSASLSGSFVYLENRTPIIRTTGQYEDIKAIIEF